MPYSIHQRIFVPALNWIGQYGPGEFYCSCLAESLPLPAFCFSNGLVDDHTTNMKIYIGHQNHHAHISLSCLILASLRERFIIDVFFSPLCQFREHRQQCLSLLRQRILHMRRNLVELLSMDDAQCLQIPQRAGEHGVGDARQSLFSSPKRRLGCLQSS